MDTRAPGSTRAPERFPGRGFFQNPSTCTGTLNAPGVLAGTYRSSVVVSGVCTVDGGAATILGNLTLSPGSVLNTTFALNDSPGGSGTSSLTVLGSVNVLSGAVLGMGCEANAQPCTDDPNAGTGGTLNGSNHVFGSLNAWSPLGVIVHASTINGSVNELGGGGGLSCDVPTSGIFSLLQSPVFSDYEDNSVGGNLVVSGLQTCWTGILRNVVRGSIVDAKNTFGDPDANEALSNTVQQNIWCFGNSPNVQYGDSGGVPNQVRGFTFLASAPSMCCSRIRHRRRPTRLDLSCQSRCGAEHFTLWRTDSKLPDCFNRLWGDWWPTAAQAPVSSLLP